MRADASTVLIVSSSYFGFGLRRGYKTNRGLGASQMIGFLSRCISTDRTSSIGVPVPLILVPGMWQQRSRPKGLLAMARSSGDSTLVNRVHTNKAKFRWDLNSSQG